MERELHLGLRSARLICVAMIATIFGLFNSNHATAQFNASNLAILVAGSNTANNTTVSIAEINKTDTLQTVIQTLLVPDTGANAIRVSGSATSTLYSSNSNDRSLFLFTGHNGSITTTNANTILQRGVVALDHTGAISVKTTYTGNSGNQTRCATTVNNVDFYIADQGGQYTNGATAPSPTGNLRAVKAFGGQVYVGMNSSTATNIEVSTTSALTGGALTGLPGLANSSTHQDFYLVSSGTNGALFDVLYIVRNTSATAGTIAKYSLDSGLWVANGTYTTTFGGYNIAVEKSGAGAALYVSTGTGATGANSVRRLFDAAGYNTTINITSDFILHTAATGTTIKGVGFAPTAPVSTTPVVTLSTNAPQVAAGSVMQGATGHLLSTFVVNVSVADDTLAAISFPVSGTFAAGDISSFSLWSNTSATIPAGAPLATVTAATLAGGQPLTFSSLAKHCPVGNTWFWITADVAATAIPGSTLGVPMLDSTRFTFQQALSTGTIQAAGLQTITALTPVIAINPATTLSFGSVTVGQVSPVSGYQITGTNLTSPIQVTAPAGFEVSDSQTGPWNDTLLFSPTAGAVNDTVFVRFAPTMAQPYAGQILHSTTGAVQVTKQVSGNGLAINTQTLVHYWNFNNNTSLANLTAPNVSLVPTASIAHIPGGTSVINVTGGSGQNFDIDNHNARFSDPHGTHLRFDNPVGGELLFEMPTTGFENPTIRFATRRSGSGAGTQYWHYRIDTSSNYTLFDSVVVLDANPQLITLNFGGMPAVNDNPHFALKVSFLPGAGGIAGNNRFDNFTLDADPLTVMPMLNSTVTSLPNFSQTVGTPSAEESFVVTGTNLSGDVQVDAPANFDVSLTSGSGFGPYVIIPHVGGAVAPTTLYVRLHAGAVGNYSGNILIASPGANTLQVAVAGACQNVLLPLPLLYYWHFNTLNTSAGDVKEIEADYNRLPGTFALMTYTGGNAGDRDMDEYSPGTLINAQMGEPEGKAARVRNPSGSRTLLFEMPTNHSTDLRFEYAVHRSSGGQLNNIIDYSVDGVSFIQTGLQQTSFPITEDYTHVVVDFSGITAVENNPLFMVRISFSGNTTAASGNNRFDNITLKGNNTIGVEDAPLVRQEPLKAWPNPVRDGVVYLNRTGDYQLYDRYGRLVMVAEGVSQIETAGLSAGLYILRERQGAALKLLVGQQ